jgi:hypothetical protein
MHGSIHQRDPAFLYCLLHSSSYFLLFLLLLHPSLLLFLLLLFLLFIFSHSFSPPSSPFLPLFPSPPPFYFSFSSLSFFFIASLALKGI